MNKLSDGLKRFINVNHLNNKFKKNESTISLQVYYFCINIYNKIFGYFRFILVNFVQNKKNEKNGYFFNTEQ